MVERRTPHAHIKLYQKMQQIAPRELKMDYDNVGLLIGPEKQEIRRVLVALDCTSVTAKEAIEWGADLMLTHHPVFSAELNALRRTIRLLRAHIC